MKKKPKKKALKVDVRGIVKSSKSYCGYDNKAEREDDLMFWSWMCAILDRLEKSMLEMPCPFPDLKKQGKCVIEKKGAKS